MAAVNDEPPPTNPTSSTARPPTRRPYHGSCHCGLTRYIAYLTLPPPLLAASTSTTSTTLTTAPPPPPPLSSSSSSPPSLRIYKCNCSTCHKMSFFHIRLADSPGDFLLLSPLDPTAGNGTGSGLRDYTCRANRIHWYFCGACGVRCFAVAGAGETREVEIEAEGKGEGPQKRAMVVPAWMVKREGWHEGPGRNYLSVNAATLEAGQEGLDLREWAERGWIAYLDKRDGVGEPRKGEPHEGGMY